MESHGAGGDSAFSSPLSAATRVSITNDDFPEPLTPVNTVIASCGIETFRDCRLFAVAPFIEIIPSPLRRLSGTAMERAPER